MKGECLKYLFCSENKYTCPELNVFEHWNVRQKNMRMSENTNCFH